VRAALARVLLTGASGGIGRAMAQQLREAGAAVLGVGREAGAPGPFDDWVQADLCTPEGVAVAARAASEFQANTAVLAAGLPCFGPLASLAPERMAAVLQTNLLAPMLLTQALLPQLQRQSRSQLVFVGSVLGRIGVPGFSVYGASKAGLHGFAEALRRELADTTVRVQWLAPRSTRTAFNDAAVQAFNEATGTPSDTPQAVAQALLSLIEDEQAERHLGFAERLAVRINALAGGLLDGSFSRHRRSLATQTPMPYLPEKRFP
jgi:short-subunit dehydrogenase